MPLFLTFFKIGAFTFGGGYAMIPLIQREAAEKQKWVSQEEILEIVAVAESTPGPIAINAATFIGQKVAGFWGAVLATTGVVLPSFAIIALLSLVLRRFESLKAVRFAFQGIRAGVLALIFRALVSMYRQCPKNALSYFVMAFAFLAAAVMGWNVFLVILLCALLGLVCSVLAERRRRA